MAPFIVTEPVLFDSHSHTTLCKHAIGEPSEYASVAHQRGLRGYMITCHNPMPDGFSASVRMAESEFEQYLELVAETREAWQDRLEVRLGIEADYFPGFESYLEKQLASADFHFVLGSVHPQLKEFRNRFWDEDPVEVQRTYFQMLADSAETGLFDSVSHPDLIKNFTSDVWNWHVIGDDVRRSLDRIAATGMAMELNTSGVLKTIPEMNPCPEMLTEMSLRKIPITLGSDAHQPDRIADDFEGALALLASCGFTHVSYFTNRHREDVAIDRAIDSLLQESRRC